MDTNFETPPMGGENIPFKELKPEMPEKQQAEVKTPAKNNKLLIGLIILLVFLFLVFVLIFLNFNKQQKPTLSPSLLASPSPLPSMSSEDGLNLQERIDKLDKNLKNMDLEESKLMPPVLDYKLRFTLEP